MRLNYINLDFHLGSCICVMKWNYWKQVVFIMLSTNLKKKKRLHNKMQAA